MIILSKLKRIFAALKSRNKSAYFGMLTIFLKPFGTVFEWLFFRQKGEVSIEDISCVFICSPPRSGSTITYQCLTKIIPSKYLSNLSFVLPKSASKIKVRNELRSSRNNYKNYYGYSYGWRGVNEGNEIIDSWFQNDPSINEIRERFLNFYSRTGADIKNPLIIKNVRNYKNVLKLHEAVPEIFLLRIKRNLTQIIQSELKAHYELGNYHPIPDELKGKEDHYLPPEFVTRQIVLIEKSLDYQFSKINNLKKVVWSYEEFCQNGLEMTRELALNAFNMDVSVLNLNPLHLKASNTKKVSDRDLGIIQQQLSILGDG